MEDYPKTLLEFEQRFATEEACANYLFKFRWPEGFRCSRCGYTKARLTKKRGVYRCSRCRFEVHITAGTIFQDTKKPLQLWFRAIWYVTTQKYGANALGLQRVLDLGCYETAWILLHKLRRAMVRPYRNRLSGTVQTDEIYIGGEKPGKRGRGAVGKTLVVVMVEVKEDKIGRIRLKRVADASGPSLEGAVKDGVEPGSIVHTDGWGGYNGLSELGYVHEVVREEAAVGRNLLPKVNRIAALLKRWLLGTYQGGIHLSHLDYYLDEYTFRFNRRTSRSRGKLFCRLIEQSLATAPVLGRDLHRSHTKSMN
jgi:transposase-like protein/DNA-directed RNA polymerase subunit RPC12/RpoP